VRPHPHNPTSFFSVTSIFTGSLPVSLCDPSHIGALADLPQLHQ